MIVFKFIPDRVQLKIMKNSIDKRALFVYHLK